jgi:hypothetical protein
MGWCAGHNPPFVFDGIQLYGLPASPAELTDAYSPFHPAGQPFHRFQPHPQRQQSHHPHLRLGVPFLLRNQGSRPTPLQALQFSVVGGVSSGTHARSRPPAHQPTKTNTQHRGDKNYASFNNKHTNIATLIFSELCVR